MIDGGQEQRDERSLHELPESVVNILGSGIFPEEAALIQKYPDGSVRRSVFKAPENFGTLGTMEFGVETKVYTEHQDLSSHCNRVDFCYKQGDTEVAYMDFRVRPDGTFELNHRYVHPDFRGKVGIGDHLLRQASQAFQALADKRQAPVEVYLEGGQRVVLSWFTDQRRGFQPRDSESATRLTEVRDHPENFVFESIGGLGDASDKVDCIFRKETEGRTIKDTVRIQLHKVFEPQQAPVT